MKLSMSSLLAAAGLLVVGRSALRRWQASRYSLVGRVVLITGGSRGLGLLMAREYARLGARLVLVARSAEELERACVELRASGAEAIGVSCDVGDEAGVLALVEHAIAQLGRLDVVVNNAGRIEVGPLPSMTAADFRKAMETNFWGAFNVINAALPHLKQGARIVNISSIGGLVSVPHLMPYSTSKFALTGFSLGLRMELARKGIAVTTVCPGLMRTGSPVNALFKGDRAAEYAWFSVADALPMLSMNGERAARAIVRASQRGDVLLVLGVVAQLAALAQALLPAAAVRASTLITRWLPQSTDTAAALGSAVPRRAPAWLTALSDRAAEENNELGRAQT